MIQLTDITMSFPRVKRYREMLRHPFKKQYKTALQDVTLKIEKGDCVGLLGPNGAGKTTLLKLIGGLLYPSKGMIRINGDDLAETNSYAREHVGFVINEDRSFYWQLTGRQNLEFFGVMEDLRGTELRTRINELFSFVDLTDAAEEVVSNYSSGMRQRLAIARGLLGDPEILLLDEPTRTIDPLGAEKLRDFIFNEIHRGKGKTLLIASHQIHEVERLCNKVCIIEKGRVLASESLERIRQKHGDLTAFYKYILQANKVERS